MSTYLLEFTYLLDTHTYKHTDISKIKLKLFISKKVYKKLINKKHF